MGYKAKIIYSQSSGVEAEDGLPTHLLAEEYPTADAAAQAAQKYIADWEYRLGEVFWDIVDVGGTSS